MYLQPYAAKALAKSSLTMYAQNSGNNSIHTYYTPISQGSLTKPTFALHICMCTKRVGTRRSAPYFPFRVPAEIATRIVNTNANANANARTGTGTGTGTMTSRTSLSIRESRKAGRQDLIRIKVIEVERAVRTELSVLVLVHVLDSLSLSLFFLLPTATPASPRERA